jgi:hypothetical protein
MSLFEMKADLPTACNVGTKRNSKGFKSAGPVISATSMLVMVVSRSAVY